MTAPCQSIASAVGMWARSQPDRAAVTDMHGSTVTYRELMTSAARVGAALTDAPGPVAYLGDDALTWAQVLVGASVRGVAALPMNWRLAPREISSVVEHARPSVVICDAQFAALIDPGWQSTDDATVVFDGSGGVLGTYEQWCAATVEAPVATPEPDTVAILMYTSGTSGTPKAVQLTNANIAANLATPTPWHVDESAVVGVPAPLFHVSGTGWLFYCLMRGAHFVSTAGSSPAESHRRLQEFRATHMLTVPAILQMFVRLAEVRTEPLTDLHTVIYGGSPLPPALIEEAADALGCDLIQTYGMTETCGPITFLTAEDHRAGGPRLASAGRVVAGVEVQVRSPGDGGAVPAGETGEIWTRSELITPGYRDNDAENARAFGPDGWFRTADCGHFDDAGYLFLTDRISDMIITGGENVYPVEVENVLAEHPDLADVAVVGVPHPKWGETVVAAVVPEPGQQPTPAEIIEHCRARIAHYKCPTRVVVVDELPRNATGKILKRDLRSGFTAGDPTG